MILTRSPLTHPQGAGPFDLHVLSTPPAFVLSQDQTLQKNQSPRQHHEPKGTHKPPRNQHHPDKQNKPSTPQTHPQKACPEHTQQKTRQTKHTKTKHTIEISNNTPSDVARHALRGQDEQHLASAWSTLAERLDSSKRKPSDLGLSKLGRPATDPPCRAWNPSGPRAATADN